MKKNLAKTKYFTAKRVATLSVLCAMGLIMFMVESLFPPLFLPGAKMGLSNIFSMLTLFLLGPTEAFILVIVRTVLGSMFTGNMSTLMYSLSAGVVSVIISSVLVEFVYPKVSIVAISIVSAVMHNLTQNVVFCLVSNTPQMFSYMPWLALIGILAGVIVGFAVWFILKMVPTRTFASMLDIAFVPTPQAQQTAEQSTEETSEQTAEQAEQSEQITQTEHGQSTEAAEHVAERVEQSGADAQIQADDITRNNV